jgi:hypothetical protein
LATHVYARALSSLREMPDALIDTWFDWGKFFRQEAEPELRSLCLQLRNAASGVSEEIAEKGRVVHADFLSLASIVNDIYTTDWDRGTPEQLAAEATRLRKSILDSLDDLKAEAG